MKAWLKDEFGPWMRHKVRVVILKQWKRPQTIYDNLMRLNVSMKCGMSDEDIYKVANTPRAQAVALDGIDVVACLCPMGKQIFQG